MSETNSGFKHGMAHLEPDVQLHYVEMGSGPRTMVLLHGYPETWRQWRHVMPLFAEAGFRVIAVDYRGAGQSSKPNGGYDKRTMAGDIQHLLTAHLGVNEPCVMVGHDIGMTIAFAFAGLYPNALERLVLVDAVVPGTATYRNALSTGKMHGSNLAHFFFHNARNNMAETLTAGRERVYLQDFFDRIAFNQEAFGTEVIDNYTAHYAAPGGMKAGFEVYRAFDQDAEDNAAMLAEAGRLKMPLLFVAGAESVVGSLAQATLGEIAENGTLVRVSRSGHYVPEENPKEFAEKVLDFCAAGQAA